MVRYLALMSKGDAVMRLWDGETSCMVVGDRMLRDADLGELSGESERGIVCVPAWSRVGTSARVACVGRVAPRRGG